MLFRRRDEMRFGACKLISEETFPLVDTSFKSQSRLYKIAFCLITYYVLIVFSVSLCVVCIFSN